MEGVAAEPFCSNSIPLSRQEKVQGISVLVKRSIQPLPLAFDLHLPLHNNVAR